ncbi:MAG TPA: hypothetical protein DCS88_13465, partial [Alphaproteobacteria bacterium]|nr:hypothetical protein [Alphaproteobacteria bacterium]
MAEDLGVNTDENQGGQDENRQNLDDMTVLQNVRTQELGAEENSFGAPPDASEQTNASSSQMGYEGLADALGVLSGNNATPSSAIGGNVMVGSEETLNLSSGAATKPPTGDGEGGVGLPEEIALGDANPVGVNPGVEQDSTQSDAVSSGNQTQQTEENSAPSEEVQGVSPNPPSEISVPEANAFPEVLEADAQVVNPPVAGSVNDEGVSNLGDTFVAPPTDVPLATETVTELPASPVVDVPEVEEQPVIAPVEEESASGQEETPVVPPTEVPPAIDTTAELPTLQVADSAGVEDQSIALDLSAVLNDTDGSESLSITISGVPDGAELSAGIQNADGSWTLSA